MKEIKIQCDDYVDEMSIKTREGSEYIDFSITSMDCEECSGSLISLGNEKRKEIIDFLSAIETKDNNPKTCPFCGHHAETEIKKDGWESDSYEPACAIVSCSNIECSVMPSVEVYAERVAYQYSEPDMDEAIRIWNKRF